MRKKIIAGNWKLNKTSLESIDLVNALKRELDGVRQADVVVCPPFTALADVHEVLTDSHIQLGAQNVYWEDSGAFTGEVSAPMLKDLGVEYVIIGHSERRQFFNETDATVNKRLNAVLNHGLVPIVCVGENLQEREGNKTFDVIRTQCRGSLAGLKPEQMKKTVIAYEPVWAIGTGKTASPAQAQEVHKFIRDLVREQFGAEVADVVRIQYGGSVKADNAAELMSQPDIDGALVGGASLKADSFSQLVKNSVH